MGRKGLINRDNFADFVNSNLLEIDDSTCDHSEYKSWKNISEEKLNNEFIKIGDLNDDVFKGNYTYTQQIDTEYEYWREDACIAVNLYPAQSAIIYQCTKCKNIFLQYMESGGHGSQSRFRLVRNELIKDKFAAFTFVIEEVEFYSFIKELGLNQSEFEIKIDEFKNLPGVPTDAMSEELYIKDRNHFRHTGFPRRYEIITSKSIVLELINKFKNAHNAGI
jgi:hypothetical protein